MEICGPNRTSTTAITTMLKDLQENGLFDITQQCLGQCAKCLEKKEDYFEKSRWKFWDQMNQ